MSSINVCIVFRKRSSSTSSHSFNYSPSLRWHKELWPNFTAILHEQTNQDSAHSTRFQKNSTQYRWTFGSKWIPGCKFYVNSVLNYSPRASEWYQITYRCKFYFHLTMYVHLFFVADSCAECSCNPCIVLPGSGQAANSCFDNVDESNPGFFCPYTGVTDLSCENLSPCPAEVPNCFIFSTGGTYICNLNPIWLICVVNREWTFHGPVSQWWGIILLYLSTIMSFLLSL